MAIRTQIIPIGSALPDPNNVRRRDDAARANLAFSLETHGPARSIVLDSENIVRAGNGTLEAATAAGCTEIIVVEPEPGQLVAVRRSDWSYSQALAYAIQDNRASDLSKNDPVALATRLEEIRSSDIPIEAAGYTDAQVDELLEQIAAEQAADIAEFEESTSQAAGVFLKWEKNNVPLTEVELDRLNDALAKHIEANGTPFGFIGSLIRV